MLRLVNTCSRAALSGRSLRPLLLHTDPVTAFRSERTYRTASPALGPRKWKETYEPKPGEIVVGEDTVSASGKSFELMGETDLTDEEIEKMLEEDHLKLVAEAEEEERKKREWVPGMRKKPLTVAYSEAELVDYYSGRPTWTNRDKRCGALGIKIGMMPVWDEWGERIACTVLYLDSNVVMEVKTKEIHGYDSVVVGAGERKKKNVTKPLLGHYDRVGVDEHPPYIVREFRINNVEMTVPTLGSRIHARHFVPGQNVDVAGISKGKGFQGAMKRHGFKGMPASHGVSLSHRALGSTGQCQDPGRVFKGKKMAGRMGNDRKTIQNMKVVKIDRGRNLIYVKGAVPGQKGNFVEIRDARKRPLFGTDLVEGGKDNSEFPPLPTFEYEENVDGSGEGGHEVMMPLSRADPLNPVLNVAA